MKKPAIFFQAIIFLLIFPLSSFSSNQAVSDLRIDRAKELLSRKDFMGASMVLKDILETSKEDSVLGAAHKIRGDIQGDIFENMEGALDEYKKALSFPIAKEDERDIHFKIAVILFRFRDFTKSADEIKIFLKNYPDSGESETARRMLGQCEEYISKPDLIKQNLGKEDYSGTEIRVAMKRVKRFNVSASGKIRISVFPDGDDFLLDKGTEISCSQKGIVVNSRDTSSQQIEIESEGGNLISLDGKLLRGKLFVMKDGGELLIINRLNIEEYLYGVLPKEVNPNWPIEALKAQAIASRSYALFRARLNTDKPFDLDATKFSQVYGGFGGENKRSNAAVDQTRGKVLTYKDRLVLAYFHSNSGGYLEDSENIWGVDLPYFEESIDKFSVDQPDYKWAWRIKLKNLVPLLKKSGFKIEKILDIVPLKKSKGGRIIKVAISHQAGKLELYGNSFRLFIGPYRMKSTLCEIRKKGDEIEFSGKGFGHGVGMSQWGAYNMAKKGYSCKDILAFYYKGTEVR